MLVTEASRRRSAATVGVALVLASPVAPVALVCAVLDAVDDRRAVLVVPLTLAMIMYMLITIITTAIALGDVTDGDARPSDDGYTL